MLSKGAEGCFVLFICDLCFLRAVLSAKNCDRLEGMATKISKKRKLIGDGIFKAEVADFLEDYLATDGFGGVDVRITPFRTDIVIKTTTPKAVIGEQGRKIREITVLIQKRFGFKEGGVEVYAERIENRGLNPIVQAEANKYKLMEGLPVRRACYAAMRFIMRSGAIGVEVRVSGKVRGARARDQKYRDGYMLKSGNPSQCQVVSAIRHVELKAGIIGIKVSIMLPHDPEGKNGTSYKQPDIVTILPPKDDKIASENLGNFEIVKAQRL